MVHAVRRLIVALLSALVAASAHAEPQSFDAHFHMASAENLAKLQMKLGSDRLPAAIGTTEALRLVEDANIGGALVLSMAYLLENEVDAQAENDFVSDQAVQTPERIYGLCGIPFYADWAEREIRRCLGKPGMKGIKLHLMGDNVDLKLGPNQLRLDNLLATAATTRPNAIVTIDHFWMDDLATTTLAQIAMKHQSLNVVLAHALVHHFRELLLIDSFFKVLPGMRKNIYIDISASSVLNARFNAETETYLKYLKSYGLDHVLFGSDYPVFTPKETTAAVRAVGFTAAELTQISTNLEALLR